MANNDNNDQYTHEKQQDTYDEQRVALEQQLSGTNKGEEANGTGKLHNTGSIKLDREIQDNTLHKIVRKHEIAAKMLKHLYVLTNFEIVIVCDDSGSMNTPIDKHSQRTRWTELREIVKTILEIGLVFDKNGVDIYFLNRDPLHKVKDVERIEGEFSERPSGYTPLVPVLNKIFKSRLAQRDQDKKLLVLIATDGAPTDNGHDPNVAELEDLMRNVRNAETTFVSFLICTDESDSIDYLDEWDVTMKNVDITNDYHSEKRKIRRHRGQHFGFTKGDYIVKALVGAIVPELDALNEPTGSNDSRTANA